MNQRISNDFYPTPTGVTKALTRRIVDLPKDICECCAGNGAITDALILPPFSYREVLESDITWNTKDDATTKAFWESRKEKLAGKEWATVTNPPFSAAESILPLAYEYSPWGVAFLLRLSYLEPTNGRAGWLEAHADNLRCFMPVNPRPKFRRDTKGTDSSTVAWIVWQKDWSWRRIGGPSPFTFVSGWQL